MQAFLFFFQSSYVTKSDLLRKGLESDGLTQPQSITTVSSYVAKSAEKKREIIREKIKKQIKEGARYSISLDEWTCSGKRSRFLNIILHYMEESTNLGMDYVNGRLPADAMKQMVIVKLKRFGLSKFLLKILKLCIGICQSSDW